MDDHKNIKDKILLTTLAHVPFDGWTLKALNRGAMDSGFDPAEVMRIFPNGLESLIEYFSDYSDQVMVKRFKEKANKEMRVRDLIVLAIRSRLEFLMPYRESALKAASFLSLPNNIPLGTRLTYKTVNAIWYAAGDKATDFNFYTKRILLSGVYTSTLLFWFNDHSDNTSASWGYLDRSINNIMKIPKLVKCLKEKLVIFPI